MILVNGEYHKQIEVTQGNILEASCPDSASLLRLLVLWHAYARLAENSHVCVQVTVYNNLPATWPLVSEGISIHWHGFSMNGAEWYDGVGYLAQCPIQAGTNFTYRFQARLSQRLHKV